MEVGGHVIERALTLPEIEAARTVMGFWSFGSEVPTEPLIAALHERGVRVALPRIEEGRLAPHMYEPGDPTMPTNFGPREPLPGAELADPTHIDVVLTPGLAFDRSCRRVGYGGGFYDRFFREAAPGAFRAGLAFALQLCDHDLPAGHADLPVHVVVTEREAVRCSAGPTPT